MTPGEIARRLTELRDDMREGFSGVNARIDGLTDQVRVTNGRVGALETETGRHDENLKGLNREIYRHGRQPVGVVTKRDVLLVLGTVGVLAAIVKWFPALMLAGQGAP